MLIILIEVKGGDSGGMRETGETSKPEGAVMVHRSPRGTRPSETEISSIIHSKKCREPSAHGTFSYEFIL